MGPENNLTEICKKRQLCALAKGVSVIINLSQNHGSFQILAHIIQMEYSSLLEAKNHVNLA